MTIDWVGLTGAILLMGITVVYALFNHGVSFTAGSINSNLSAMGDGVNTGAAPNQDTFGSLGVAGSGAGSGTGTGAGSGSPVDPRDDD